MAFAGRSSFAAYQWLARRPGAESLLLGRPLVEIGQSGPGRGLGLFAISPIQAFSQVVAERPLILMQPNDDLPELYEQFLSLTDEQQHDYIALSYTTDANRDQLLQSKIVRRGLDSTHGESALAEMVKVANVMQTNAFNVDLNDLHGSHHRALFPTIARINHSCAPNAHVCFYPPTSEARPQGQMVVYALRRIEVDEEVLISYFNILLPRHQRQEKARKWGFQCHCPVCDDEMPDAAGEQMRKHFQAFHASQAGIMQSMRVTLREINSLAGFGNTLVGKALEQPALIPALPDLFDAMGLLQAKAAVVQLNEDNRDKIVEHLEQSVLWEARITGSDSLPTTRRLQKLMQFAAKKDSLQKAMVSVNENNEYVVVWREL